MPDERRPRSSPTRGERCKVRQRYVRSRRWSIPPTIHPVLRAPQDKPFGNSRRITTRLSVRVADVRGTSPRWKTSRSGAAWGAATRFARGPRSGLGSNSRPVSEEVRNWWTWIERALKRPLSGLGATFPESVVEICPAPEKACDSTLRIVRGPRRIEREVGTPFPPDAFSCSSVTVRPCC
jgi:hypothetical protein